MNIYEEEELRRRKRLTALGNQVRVFYILFLFSSSG
jgi:hypothetical protein